MNEFKKYCKNYLNLKFNARNSGFCLTKDIEFDNPACSILKSGTCFHIIEIIEKETLYIKAYTHDEDINCFTFYIYLSDDYCKYVPYTRLFAYDCAEEFL